MTTTVRPRIARRSECRAGALREDWASFIRTADAYYGRLATASGQPYVHLSAEEIAGAAALARALGVTPQDAGASLRFAARR
jgi:hypothetical protein